jgi:hypothetical protein
MVWRGVGWENSTQRREDAKAQSYGEEEEEEEGGITPRAVDSPIICSSFAPLRLSGFA